MKILKPVLDWRVQGNEMVCPQVAYSVHGTAGKMSTEAFENFYFNACCMDYNRMTQGMTALKL